MKQQKLFWQKQLEKVEWLAKNTHGSTEIDKAIALIQRGIDLHFSENRTEIENRIFDIRVDSWLKTVIDMVKEAQDISIVQRELDSHKANLIALSALMN